MKPICSKGATKEDPKLLNSHSRAATEAFSMLGNGKMKKGIFTLDLLSVEHKLEKFLSIRFMECETQ